MPLYGIVTSALYTFTYTVSTNHKEPCRQNGPVRGGVDALAAEVDDVRPEGHTRAVGVRVSHVETNGLKGIILSIIQAVETQACFQHTRGGQPDVFNLHHLRPL